MIFLEEESMYRKISLIFVLALAIIFMLAACQRSASQAPLASLTTPTEMVGDNTNEQTTGIGQIELIGTTEMMTAMAPTSTPIGSLPTITLSGSENTSPDETQESSTEIDTTPEIVTTPVIIVATATPGVPTSYTLMPGEFPYCIARRFDVNQAELLSLNDLTSSSQLQPGWSLSIPQTGNPFVGERSLHTHPTTYTVSSSQETIYKVACYFGDVDPSQIIAANGLVEPYTLTINQTLNIP
jgi:LysM repeat protein